MQERVMS